MLLETRRERLYEDMPVHKGWHEVYARGKVSTDRYWDLAKRLYKRRTIV